MPAVFRTLPMVQSGTIRVMVDASFRSALNIHVVSVTLPMSHLSPSFRLVRLVQLSNRAYMLVTFAVFQPVRSSVASFVQYSNMWPISLTLPVSQPSMLRSVSRWSWLNSPLMSVTLLVFQPSMLRLVMLVQYSNM